MHTPLHVSSRIVKPEALNMFGQTGGLDFPVSKVSICPSKKIVLTLLTDQHLLARVLC